MADGIETRNNIPIPGVAQGVVDPNTGSPAPTAPAPKTSQATLAAQAAATQQRAEFADPTRRLQREFLAQREFEIRNRANLPDLSTAAIGTVPGVRGVQLSQVTPAQAAQLALDPSNQSRNLQFGSLASQAGVQGQQQALIAQLQAQAAGQGPSLAEAQLRAASERGLAQQLALAGSQRGGSQAASQRQLLQQQAQIGQQLAGDVGALRLAEQQQAQQALAGVLQGVRAQELQAVEAAGGIRGQDLAVAQSQAELQQQANLANLETRRQTALQQGDIDLARALQDQQSRQQVAVQQAQLQQQTFLANQQAALQQQQQRDAFELALRDQIKTFILDEQRSREAFNIFQAGGAQAQLAAQTARIQAAKAAEAGESGVGLGQGLLTVGGGVVGGIFGGPAGAAAGATAGSALGQALDNS